MEKRLVSLAYHKVSARATDTQWGGYHLSNRSKVVKWSSPLSWGKRIYIQIVKTVILKSGATKLVLSAVGENLVL